MYVSYNMYSIHIYSNYNIYTLLNQRAIRYKDKPLFQTISNNKISTLTYSKSWKIIQSIGSYLQSNLQDHHTIGLYSKNNLRNVLVDLACLAYNIRVVPIPMNLSSDHFEYVLNHAEISHLFFDATITEFSLDVMDDTINISWDIKVNSIKEIHIEKY